jgi:fused signal recognition particle receptor
MSQDILKNLQTIRQKSGITKTAELKAALRSELRNRLNIPPEISFSEKPTIILIVGVNGSGKTTTIAKLGQRFSDQGLQVVLGAADTFRAAAVDQLQIWADKLNLPIIAGQTGGDSGAVAYDTVQSAVSRKADVALIDTAGRLHTRFNLMEELKKVYRVVGKALPGAPHAVWLVMDATTGQNALQQARAFKQAVKCHRGNSGKIGFNSHEGWHSQSTRIGITIFFAGLGEKQMIFNLDPGCIIVGILENKLVIVV